MIDKLFEEVGDQLLERFGFGENGEILAEEQLKIFSFLDWFKAKRNYEKPEFKTHKEWLENKKKTSKNIKKIKNHEKFIIH